MRMRARGMCSSSTSLISALDFDRMAVYENPSRGSTDMET